MKENDNINDLFLFINKNNKQKTIYKKISKKLSILKDYHSICSEIIKVYLNKDKLEEKDLKPLVIHLLDHPNPNIGKFIIYDKEDWDFLYNFNLINECISSKSNKLKIDYEIIGEKNNINKKVKEENFKKILNYLKEKIPQNFYLNILIKFLSANKDLEDSFKNFFLIELKKSNINEIEQIKKKNEILKDFVNELINNNEINKEKIKNYYDNKNLNDQKNEVLKTLNSIKEIIFDIEENSENLNEKIHRTEIKNESIKKYKNDFEPIENGNIFLTYFNSNIDKNKFLDENNFFKKLNKDEYYVGIEVFEDEINRSIDKTK